MASSWCAGLSLSSLPLAFQYNWKVLLLLSVRQIEAGWKQKMPNISISHGQSCYYVPVSYLVLIHNWMVSSPFSKILIKMHFRLVPSTRSTSLLQWLSSLLCLCLAVTS